MWKIKLFSLSLLLLLAGSGLWAQAPETIKPPTVLEPPADQPYLIAKIEVPGVVLNAKAYAEYYLVYRPIWQPTWLAASLEAGKLPHAFQFTLGGCYVNDQVTFDTYFYQQQLYGLRVGMAYRKYLQPRAPQGWYLQPTFKYQWYNMKSLEREGLNLTNQHQFRLSFRTGFQLKLVKRLYMDAAIGPGLSLRNISTESGWVEHNFGIAMPSNIRDPFLTLGRLYGPVRENELDIYLDSSLALGWRF